MFLFLFPVRLPALRFDVRRNRLGSGKRTETQQLILPITIPLYWVFLSWFTRSNILKARYRFGVQYSLTSPMVMMARIPFGGVPFGKRAVVKRMVVTFLLFVWLSGKIYRVGILMYGKKASFKELWKWMWYKS